MAELALAKLLAAEKEANAVVNAARRQRADMLKAGREQAQAEVASERLAAEEAFRTLLARYDSELAGRVAGLEAEQQAALSSAALAPDLARSVASALLEATLTVRLQAPERPLAPFGSPVAAVAEEAEAEAEAPAAAAAEGGLAPTAEEAAAVEGAAAGEDVAGEEEEEEGGEEAAAAATEPPTPGKSKKKRRGKGRGGRG
eukprot:jgi/Tetstr1/444276/TSEL_032168.t1